MEKDRILDTPDAAQIKGGSRTLLWRGCWILSWGLYLCLSGCAPLNALPKKDPLSPKEHLELGKAYEQRGELEAAERQYLLAVEGMPRAYLYLGNLSYQRGDLDQAESYYKKGLKVGPPDADLYNNLAWIYYVKGKDLDQAEGYVLEAIRLSPSKYSIYQDTLKKIRRLRESRIPP